MMRERDKPAFPHMRGNDVHVGDGQFITVDCSKASGLTKLEYTAIQMMPKASAGDAGTGWSSNIAAETVKSANALWDELEKANGQ